MLDIPQTKVWGVLIGDTEEGTHYVCFTTCGKNRVGNRFHARVMMSVKREHTHLRCQFDLRAVERPLSFLPLTPLPLPHAPTPHTPYVAQL